MTNLSKKMKATHKNIKPEFRRNLYGAKVVGTVEGVKLLKKIVGNYFAPYFDPTERGMPDGYIKKAIIVELLSRQDDEIIEVEALIEAFKELQK